MGSYNLNTDMNKDKSRNIDFDLSMYKLTENEKKVLIHFIKYPALNQVEISKMLNFNQDTVSRIKRRPEFQRAYNDFCTSEAKTWIQILIDARKKASLKLVKHIDSDNDNTSIRAIENILQLDKLDLSDDSPEQSPY